MNPVTATIEITPKCSLIDEELDVLAEGICPYSHVTFVCRVQEDGVRYFSCGHYISDRQGQVDLQRMAALPGGTYEGIEPMGLIWSQKAEPGQAPGKRLVKSDVTTPIITHIYVLGGIVPSGECLEAVARGQWLCHTTCERTYRAEGVERIEIKKNRLWGSIFIPSGPGPFPGVLDLFGAIGGLVEHRSALLASRGVVSFTICYFKSDEEDGLIQDIEFFEEALDVLLNHDKVHKPYVGVIGVSKGAELALLIASLCSKVRACVSIGGYDYTSLTNHSYKGEIFFPMNLNLDTMEVTEEGCCFTPALLLHTKEDHANHAIPVERGACDYLLIHGMDDQCVPHVFSKYVTDRLDKNGRSNYRVLTYPGAGHLIEPPHSPLFYATFHRAFNTLVIWGGEPRQHARAQEDAWKEVLTFFKTKLGPVPYTDTMKSRL